MASPAGRLAGHGAAAPLVDSWKAVREAERCLGCYDAPCTAACPTHIDVPRFISRLRTGNLEGAYETLASANVLPAICGLVCPTEYLCEGACVLTRLYGRPVRIGDLQYFVCKEAQAVEACPVEKPARVAVVGGGPAGIACAATLRRLGYVVDLYDRHERLGGLAGYSIPNYRLPDQAIAAETRRLAGAGINLRLGAKVDASHLSRMIAEYDAVFLGVGLGVGKMPDMPGLELGGVWSALDYLEAVRRAGRGEGLSPDISGRVVVVGGGNVAVDAACVASVEGAAEVLVLYRRTVNEMPAWESEYQDAASMGVQFCWLTGVSEVIGEQGRVRGVRAYRMQLAGEDESGRRAVRPIPQTDEIIPCDYVIMAVGQALELEDLQKLGLEVNPNGTLRVDPTTRQTARPGVFAGGDAIRGGNYVVQAVADGIQAASAIDRYISEAAR